MHPPPLFAERLLRWSLGPDDRDAVLGDMQEEYAAIAAARGSVTASRWYWWQTVLSVLPILLKRVRGDRVAWRATESKEDRALRMQIRRAAILFLLVGGLLFASGFVTTDVMFPVGFILIFLGGLILLTSLGRIREFDRLTRELNQRRNNLFWLLFILGTWPERFVPASYAHIARTFEFLPWLASAGVAFWPRKYWIFGGVSRELMKPQVWSPFTSTRRETGGLLLLPVDAPDGPAKLGDLILGREGDSRIEIRRVFGPHDGLRVFAPVGNSTTPLNVTVDLFDMHDRCVLSKSASTTAATSVSGTEWWRRPVPPTVLIDETIPLDGCLAGAYRVVVTADDGSHASQKSAELRVGPPASKA